MAFIYRLELLLMGTLPISFLFFCLGFCLGFSLVTLKQEPKCLIFPELLCAIGCVIAGRRCVAL